MSWVAGVDGCRAGWVVVLMDHDKTSHLARVVPDFAAVVTLPEAPLFIGIDVPIGLLATAHKGGRECEVLARQLLRGRSSSVFSSPTRAALGAFRAGADYEAVSAANRGGVEDAPGISRQAFSIMPKIDEVNRTVVPSMQRSIREVHPELCFAEANDQTPMIDPKKRTSGRAERLGVLERLGFRSPLLLLGARLPRGVKADDLLDACIACWTAGRIAAGTAVVIPEEPPIDLFGLRMELWR